MPPPPVYTQPGNADVTNLIAVHFSLPVKDVKAASIFGTRDQSSRSWYRCQRLIVRSGACRGILL